MHSSAYMFLLQIFLCDRSMLFLQAFLCTVYFAFNHFLNKYSNNKNIKSKMKALKRRDKSNSNKTEEEKKNKKEEKHLLDFNFLKIVNYLTLST